MTTNTRIGLSLVGFALAAAFGAACTKKDTNPPDGKAACTEEAKVCPDGSSVSREGPNCEFAECPAAAEPEGDAPEGEPAGDGETKPADGETPPAESE
jgi:hypothetical protein